MTKPSIKADVLRKMVVRLIKAAPVRKPAPADPLTRLIRAFLEYDCDDARSTIAERKIMDAMVDFNELRVTPAIELAAILGVRYPFAESRCAGLHRTLQSLFDREHHMRLERLREMKKSDIRPYFQSLAGITPYAEAAVCVDSFGLTAAPVDTKLLLWLISREALPEGIDIKTAQQALERQLRNGEAEDFFHGSRREIDDWAPKSWPQVAKVPSPILAPPPADAPAESAAAAAPRPAVKPEPAKSDPKGKTRVPARKK